MSVPINPEHTLDAPFTRLVAFEVYDGPVAGIVFARDSMEPFLFTLLSWDSAQRRRVFSLATIDRERVAECIEEISRNDEPRWPEWWLQFITEEKRRSEVSKTVESLRASASQPIRVVVSADLLVGVEHSASIISDKMRAEFADLSKRSTADQEVSDATFDEWIRFIESA